MTNLITWRLDRATKVVINVVNGASGTATDVELKGQSVMRVETLRIGQ